MFEELEDNTEAFDAAIALYIWLSEWHDGMWGDRYAAMCRMGSQYRLEVRGGLDDSSQIFYDELTEENWEAHFNSWCEYMDTKYDSED
jgi:hypothetical protein